MAKNKNKNINWEIIVRNTLIVLTFISFVVLLFNTTYHIYQNLNIESINEFIIKYINSSILWIDTILLYVFAIIYIVLAIKSKKEVVVKVSFSVLAILTNIVTMTIFINKIADCFRIFN